MEEEEAVEGFVLACQLDSVVSKWPSCGALLQEATFAPAGSEH